MLDGTERTGLPEAALRVNGLNPAGDLSRFVAGRRTASRHAASISPQVERVKVRAIRIDEALIIARPVARVLNIESHRKH